MFSQQNLHGQVQDQLSAIHERARLDALIRQARRQPPTMHPRSVRAQLAATLRTLSRWLEPSVLG